MGNIRADIRQVYGHGAKVSCVISSSLKYIKVGGRTVVSRSQGNNNHRSINPYICLATRDKIKGIPPLGLSMPGVGKSDGAKVIYPTQ